jgi:alkaline phosphatase D
MTLSVVDGPRCTSASICYAREMKRRRFLQASAAASVLPFVNGCPTGPGIGDAGEPEPDYTLDPATYDNGETMGAFADDVALDEATFRLGVSAGGMTASTALLWGFVDGGGNARLRVWRDTATEGEVALVVDEMVTPLEAGAVRFDADGLAPATTYQYALFAEDGDGNLVGRSAVGRFRTAWPEDWDKPLTLGGVTCTSWENRPYQALQVMADEDELDLFVHLGDMSYNDEAFTEEEYRALWHTTLSDPGYRALLERTGGYYAWDDHEFQNNLNPETVDAARFAAAHRTFFENIAAVEGEGGEIYRSYRWGTTAEIFILDCRTLRRPSEMQSGVSAYLGEAQTAWLKGALQSSPCHFKILLNSVPMTRMPQLWALAGDRWQGYPAARTDLLQFLEDEGIERVWFLSGDFHMGFVGRVEPDGFGRQIWEVAVGPSGNLGNPLALLINDPDQRDLVFPESQFLYGGARLSSTTLTFDPRADTVRVRYVAGNDGEVLFDETITPET